MKPSSLLSYLDIATEAALAGGAILRQHLGHLTNIRSKGTGNLVTEADEGAEKTILNILHRHFPEHTYLGEESGFHQASQQDFCWVIDPLDGTTNFAHGVPFFAVSVSLLIEGQPQVGVTYLPVADELFRAASGQGATLNRQPIHVAQTTHLPDALLATGFPYERRTLLDNNYREFMHLMNLCRDLRRPGSACLDLAYVACGRFDGFWEQHLGAWDISAGIVLVKEAGGQVSALDGTPVAVQTGAILATNGAIHPAMVEALRMVRTSNT